MLGTPASAAPLGHGDASVVTIRIAKTDRSVRVSGSIDEPSARKVKVVLRKVLDSGATKVVARETPETSRVAGTTAFAARFDRPRRGHCRIDLAYNDPNHEARMRATKDFPCFIPAFGKGQGTFTTDAATSTIRLLIADTWDEHAYGLMYRAKLADDKGMAFLFPEDVSYGFHMKDTLIPLSIAFFDVDGEILQILDMEPCEEEPCPTYDPGVTYRGALEVNQGAFEEWGVRIGDHFSVTAEE